MSSVVSDSLLDAINDDAFRELDTEVIIEKIKIPLVNNEETVKKIEDSKRFLTANSVSAGSTGLKSEKTTYSSQAKPSSTYESTRTYGYNSTPSSTTSSYYNSSYRYGQEKETVNTRAAKIASEVFSRIKKRVDSQATSDKPKSNWNILQIMDDEKLEEMKGKKPKKVLTKEQAKRKIFWCKFGIAVVRSAMEVLYVSYHEEKK
jgi:hypothetical protein